MARSYYPKTRTTRPQAEEVPTDQAVDPQMDYRTAMLAGPAMNPLSSPAGGYISSPPVMSGPSYKSTQNPVEAAANQRDLAQWRGDQISAENDQDYWTGAGREQEIAGKIEPTAEEWMRGGGGYTDEEKQRIYQDGRENENYLTDEERAASMGNTGSWGDYFNPDASEGAQRESAGLQRGAAQRLNERVSQAVNPDQLRQSEGYRAKSQQALKDNRKGTWDTILSNAENVRGAEDATGANVRGAIDPSQVTTSQQFLDDYNMSPEEKQNFVEAQGVSAGTGYRAATGELQRKALAAGANPMGVGAYRARMERAAAGDAADAMLKARSTADQMEADRKMSGEQLRQQGGRYLTDTRVNSEMQLGRDRANLENEMGSQAINSQMRLGENEVAQANTEEGNRQSAEQYLTGASMDAAKIGAGAELETEGNINNQQRQVGQYNTTTGTNIATGKDNANADRGYRAATNRQGVSMTNQQNASQRGQVVGNARMDQQKAGMGVLQQQGQQQNQNAQNARNRQQQTYSTQTGATNQATAIGAAADNAAKSRPSTFDKVMGGISGGLGAAASFLEDGGVVGLNGPELAVLGERGPEAVVPLDGKPGAKTRMGNILGTAGGIAGGMSRPSPYASIGKGIGDLVGEYRARRGVKQGMDNGAAAAHGVVDQLVPRRRMYGEAA